MVKKTIKIFLIFSIFLAAPLSASAAYNGDISINDKDIHFSSNNFLEGQSTRIYATISSYSDKDLLGVVRFFDNGAQIKSDQAISILAHKTDDVFIDWIPEYGAHKIAVKIFPWEAEIDDPSNNWVTTEIFAAQDTDHDGIPNDKDDDDDGDNVKDADDAFPLNPHEQYDTDGDGIGNNADKDDDNDGVPDEFDDLPLDPNETIDTDKDGIGNIADQDDDGDGLSDTEEENLKTNPLKKDMDDDGINDKEDVFPLDPEEWLDTDKDGIGNNLDTDDDNDKISDKEDGFPLNIGPVIKLKEKNSNFGLLQENTFDASESYDEDGEIKTFVWEIDGKTFEGNSVNYRFNSAGKHNVKLTVTDNSGESKTYEIQANVTNLKFYKQIGATIFVIFLALILFFKYILKAKIS